MSEKKRTRYNKGYSISKRGKNSYRIRVLQKGHRYEYTYRAPEELSESKQYAQAEKEAIKFRDKIVNGFSGQVPVFKDYLNYVIKTKEELNIKRSTLAGYKYLVPRLVEEFGEDKLDSITPYRLTKLRTG